MSAIMNWYKVIDKEKVQFDFLVCFKSELTYEEEIISQGGKVFYLGELSVKSIFKYTKKIHKLFIKNNYDTIHSHAPNISFLYFYIAKKCNVKNLIMHSHSTKYASKKLKSARNYLLCKLGVLQATAYCACSKEAGDFLFGNTKPYKIIKNAIDYKKFSFNHIKRKEYREKIGIKDEFVFGHIGRFEAEKNHEFLISTFKIIKEKNENTKLLLIGDGSLKDDILKKIKNLEIENDVIFLGVRKDIPELMQCIDSIIFPSIFEGLGITLIEAQVSGMPIFASESIPSEVDLDGKIHFLGLDKKCDYWADYILQNLSLNRSDKSDLIKCKGYDSESISKDIELYYEEVVMNGYKY